MRTVNLHIAHLKDGLNAHARTKSNAAGHAHAFPVCARPSDPACSWLMRESCMGDEGRQSRMWSSHAAGIEWTRSALRQRAVPARVGVHEFTRSSNGCTRSPAAHIYASGWQADARSRHVSGRNVLALVTFFSCNYSDGAELAAHALTAVRGSGCCLCGHLREQPEHAIISRSMAQACACKCQLVSWHCSARNGRG